MLRVLGVLVALLACGGACAQVSGSVALVSDYRYRGGSLSDQRPAVQASVGWEHVDGWYAGGFASSTRLADRTGVHLVSYLGYAARLDNGLSWDAGAQLVALSGHADDTYREIYFGLASQRLSARVYYQSPALGPQGTAVYAELNGAHALSERVQLLGHIGWARHSDGEQRQHFDARVGVGMVMGRFSTQLVRVANDGGSGYYSDLVDTDAADDGWVLSVSRPW